MFKKSTIISLSVFFILMIFTSVVKNSARNIEKNIDTKLFLASATPLAVDLLVNGFKQLYGGKK